MKDNEIILSLSTEWTPGLQEGPYLKKVVYNKRVRFSYIPVPKIGSLVLSLLQPSPSLSHSEDPRVSAASLVS